MKHLLSTIIVFFLSFISILAQVTEPVLIGTNENNLQETTLRDFLSEFDLEEVSSGFLREAGFEWLDFSVFDGDSTKVDIRTDILSLASILESISSMDLSGRFWNYRTDFNTFQQQVESGGSIPILIALYQYHALSESALNNQQIQYLNSRLYPIATRSPEILYESKELCAFAPFTPFVQVSSGGIISFHVQMTDYCNINPDAILLDMDDGLGFRSVSDGATVSVSYAMPGEKNLRLKVVQNGQTFYAYSSLFVESASPNARSSSNSGIDMSAYNPVEFSGHYHGESVSAILTCHLSTAANHQHKPLIFVEGYDQLDMFTVLGTAEGDYGNFFLQKFISGTPEEKLPNHILDGFDIYYIDWKNAEADIRANADLLKDILDEINSRKHDLGSHESNILIGQSMGGLVARIALREMELASHDHEVGYYVSHDAPYKGVNLPVGYTKGYTALKDYLQSNWIYNTYNFLSYFGLYHSIFTQIDKALYSKAVQQMSRNYITLSNTLDNTAFNELQSYLNQLGFPQGDANRTLHNLAAINGGDIHAYSELLSVNQGHLLSASINTIPITRGGVDILGSILGILDVFNNDFLSHLLAFAPGISNCNVDAEINPNTEPGKSIYHFRGIYSKLFGPLIIRRTIYEAAEVSDQNIVPLDDLSSSSFIPIDTLQIIHPKVSSPLGSYGVVARCLFVPVYSSLSMQNAEENNLARDFSVAPANCHETPFDAYCMPTESEDHISRKDFPWYWLIDNLQDRHIECPDTIHVGDTLKMIGYDRPVTWECIPGNMAIEQSSGVVSNIYGESDVTIIASDFYHGEFIKRSRSVHIVPPPYPEYAPLYISTGIDENGWYAEVTSSNSSYNEWLQNASPASFHWQYKLDDNEMVWLNTPGRRFYLGSRKEYARFKINLTVQVCLPDATEDYLSTDIYNNVRIQLINPQQLIVFGNNVFATLFGQSGYAPFYFNDPLIIACSTDSNTYEGDENITETMTLTFEDGTSFTTTKSNNTWYFPVFLNEATIDRLFYLFSTLEEGETGFLRMYLENSDSVRMEDFIIPVHKSGDSL